MKEQVMGFVVQAVKEVADEQGLAIPADLGETTRLFGEGGLLDSLALVSLVIAVEQGIEERFGKRVELSDDKALSQKNSPYRTIGSLSAYAAAELDARA